MVMRAAAMALWLANVDYLQRHPETPALLALYHAGDVFYEQPPPELDDNVWRDIGAALADPSYLDCRVLAPWYAAELTHQGTVAHPRVSYWVDQTGTPQFHVDVRVMATGQILDPSRMLGMP